MNYQPPQSRIPTVRRPGSILMKQRPARSGTLLDEAIRPANFAVARYSNRKINDVGH